MDGSCLSCVQWYRSWKLGILRDGVIGSASDPKAKLRNSDSLETLALWESFRSLGVRVLKLARKCCPLKSHLRLLYVVMWRCDGKPCNVSFRHMRLRVDSVSKIYVYSQVKYDPAKI